MRLENDSTTKIERDIDAALKMLNEVQSPAAMTSRIHQRLDSSAVTFQQARSGRMFWIPATCTAMAAVLLVVFFHVHSMRRKQTSTIQTAKMVVAPAAVPEVAMPPRALVSSENFSEQKLSTVHSISHRKRGEHPPAANLLSYPLTRQEKLLIRFVQTASPADLQALNPEYQAKVEARQDAEFAAYLKAGSSSSYNESTENTQE